jgi:hypothetical protein
VSEPDADVSAAERLEREAQQLVDDGRAQESLTLALDQLRADRANGEPLASAVASLRAAIDDAHHNSTGDAPE